MRWGEQVLAEPDPSYCLFGTEALLNRLQALTQEIEGVRKSEDIEYIHRMRVASRRLRSGFALFSECLPHKQFAGWEKQVKRITRSLGAARDTDVQLDFLLKFLDGLAEVEGGRAFRPGIDRFVLRLQQRRQQLQAEVIQALDHLQTSQTLDEMGEALRQALVQARLSQTIAHSPYVYQRANSEILLRLEELLSYESYIYQPEHIAELHAMRIAAKRLRYTMEMFAPLYPGGLKEPLRAARAVQEMIGDIHDCDVWAQALPLFLEKERARAVEYLGHARSFKRLTAGLLYLQQDRQQRRAARYQEFIKFWNGTQKQAVWQGLRQTLQNTAPAQVSEAPEPVAAREGNGSEKGPWEE